MTNARRDWRRYPISAASAQMAARHLLNRKTGLLANFRCGVIRVLLVVGRLLPVFPRKRTSLGPVAMSQRCHFRTWRAQLGCPLCASVSGHRHIGLPFLEKPNPDGSLVTALRWRLRSPPNRSVRATPYGKLYVRPRLIPRPAFTVPIEGTVRLVTPDFMPRTCS